MTISLRDIGTFMDPVDESIGLRHVTLHHRWIDSPASVSLAEIGKRHTHPDSVQLRFLWYNTFLMRVRIAVAKGLADSATPFEVMNALGVSPMQVLKQFDVCDLLPSGPWPIPGPRELCKVANNIVEHVIDYLGGVEAVVNGIIGMVGAEKVIENILRLAGIPGQITLKEKPALKPRAFEIGQMLRNNGYHIAALCELWNSDLRDILIDAWVLPKTSKNIAQGKPEGDVFLGDGLMFGSTEGRIIEIQRYEYNTKGIDRTPGQALDMLVDDELWACKAALLVRIDAGVGILDIYLTHLYYGTGLDTESYLSFTGIDFSNPKDNEREHVRSRQLNELSSFINKTHHHNNIAVVCGDFNIDGRGQSSNYRGLNALRNFASVHNLQDMWSVAPHTDFEGLTDGDFDKICPLSPQGFCVDKSGNNLNSGSQIDFLFVEQPQSHHSFLLDVTRVRRRSFLRPQETEGQKYMSDHLGLDCTFLASRK